MEYLTNSLEEVRTLKQNFLKNKVVTGQTPSFVIGPFFTSHSICINIGFWQGSFALSILVLWTKKRYSSFFRKVFFFKKISFKEKVVKTFKISSGCHIKTCRSLKWRALSFENPYYRFLEESMLLLLALKWNLWDKACSCVKTKTNPNFAVKVGERSSHLFSVYLMKGFIQTSALFINIWNGMYRT